LDVVVAAAELGSWVEGRADGFEDVGSGHVAPVELFVDGDGGVEAEPDTVRGRLVFPELVVVAFVAEGVKFDELPPHTLFHLGYVEAHF